MSLNIFFASEPNYRLTVSGNKEVILHALGNEFKRTVGSFQLCNLPLPYVLMGVCIFQFKGNKQFITADGFREVIIKAGKIII